MADGKALSSDAEESDEEQHQRDPIQAAIGNGPELSKPERASISRKRKVVENKGKYKVSRMQKSMSKTPVYYRINQGNHSFSCCTETELACCSLISASNYKNFVRNFCDFQQLLGIFLSNFLTFF